MDTTTTTPTDRELMNAALAASIRQTFTGLLAMPARLGDIEPTTGDQTPTPPAAGDDDGQTPAAIAVGPMTGQTPAARRQTGRQRTRRPRVVVADLDPRDAF